jgi:hypothetical protein
MTRVPASLANPWHSMRNKKWFGEFSLARSYVKWQLKVPVSESIPEEVKKWRWETGAAVPGTTVCMYDAAVKGVRLGQMYHDYHGQRMLRVK